MIEYIKDEEGIITKRETHISEEVIDKTEAVLQIDRQISSLEEMRTIQNNEIDAKIADLNSEKTELESL